MIKQTGNPTERQDNGKQSISKIIIQYQHVTINKLLEWIVKLKHHATSPEGRLLLFILQEQLNKGRWIRDVLEKNLHQPWRFEQSIKRGSWYIKKDQNRQRQNYEKQ